MDDPEAGGSQAERRERRRVLLAEAREAGLRRLPQLHEYEESHPAPPVPRIGNLDDIWTDIPLDDDEGESVGVTQTWYGRAISVGRELLPWKRGRRSAHDSTESDSSDSYSRSTVAGPAPFPAAHPPRSASVRGPPRAPLVAAYPSRSASVCGPSRRHYPAAPEVALPAAPSTAYIPRKPLPAGARILVGPSTAAATANAQARDGFESQRLVGGGPSRSTSSSRPVRPAAPAPEQQQRRLERPLSESPEQTDLGIRQRRDARQVRFDSHPVVIFDSEDEESGDIGEKRLDRMKSRGDLWRFLDLGDLGSMAGKSTKQQKNGR
ncbi:hypothetical protein K402DRAFT_454336 [Aulographum hederae CBS 113979]|uniref:Uncharacterized protein n=1 Tax=Aulographum hederae CBS 113979 TaxID=1176131 RepID=A0A6G1H032_9PEZI|nr:hypothetical protein K402DRAFT_454336 [Aulographum hederae CBS 113979]